MIEMALNGQNRIVTMAKVRKNAGPVLNSG